MINSKKIKQLFTFFLFIIFVSTSGFSIHEEGLKFGITFDQKVYNNDLTGRVYIMISDNNKREPRFQVRRITGIPFFGQNVSVLKAGEYGYITNKSYGFPLKSLRDLPAGEYYIQAFINVYTKFKRADGHTLWLHNDQWEGQNWLRSPGNLYSSVQKIKIDTQSGQTIHLTCNHKIPPVKIPKDTRWIKRIKIKSKLLSDFWGQPMYLGATILLPGSYHQDKNRSFPVNYIQGHFSLRNPYGFNSKKPIKGNRWGKRGWDFYKFWNSKECPQMLAITLQHPCPWYDDSHAMNSPNLGPYGDAILTELIPVLEGQFRIIRKPEARILSGGSTGGWISFALQVLYPDFFGGTFSLCPDALDFRAHQIVNIYQDKNAYYTEHKWMKVERPNLRSADGKIIEMMKDENHYELAVGDKCRSGGQWEIYNACYGPVGKDGYPREIWDKKTGTINSEVAKYWLTHFDLRHYLENNWSTVGPKLVGKLHIYVGDMDSYYLNNGVKYMEEFLKKTQNPHFEGVIEYGDGKPHCWGPRGPELIKLIDRHLKKHRK